MAVSPFGVNPAWVAAGVLILVVAACDDGRPRRFALPLTPTPPPIAVPPPSPAPSPRPPAGFGPLEFTPLQIGQVVRGRLDAPPECINFAGWPCRYFQVTPAASGRLAVMLTVLSGDAARSRCRRLGERRRGPRRAMGPILYARRRAGPSAGCRRQNLPHHHVVHVCWPPIRAELVSGPRHDALAASILRADSPLAKTGRTLSGVTRRADARFGPDVDRRVTFDRAVWTKPLAFAADAVGSAMAVQS